MGLFRKYADAVLPTPVVDVAMIHAEIDSAQTRLLKDALELLDALGKKNEIAMAEVKLREEHASLHRQLGFVKADVVQREEASRAESMKISAEAAAAQKQAEVVKYYSQTYPFLKFLTEQEMQKICTKYGLMYAPISAYIKNVPLENLREIKNAQMLNNADWPINTWFLKVLQFNSYDSTPQSIRSMYLKGITVDESQYRSPDDHTLRAVLDKMKPHDYPAIAKWERVRTIKQGLFIAAPKSHFNLKDLQKNEENNYFPASREIIQNDPIVFRFVKGGMQVLSKWGEEAKDPALVVPKLN